VLGYIFKERLKKGQIDNLSNEMMEDNLWEEYADLAMHEEFFNVHQLLYKAFNGKFPLPEAVQFEVKITAMSAIDLTQFEKNREAALIRLLIAGMPKNTILYRLFDEQIDGAEFKEAKDIIWQLSMEKPNEHEVLFNVISSSYWFHDIKFMEDFEEWF
jgi:hypothetical protein